VIEIMFRGRGGQGAVVASEILGRAFFLDNKYPQCFSLFGGERRGSPVTSFLRVDDQPVLLKCQIKRPDHMIILDLSLISGEEIAKELKPAGVVLINTPMEIDAFNSLRGFTVGLVDASSIARDTRLEGTFNTALLGSYVRLTGLLRLEMMIEAVRAMVPAKIEQNVRAVNEAYRRTKIYAPIGKG
jgi:2-oxoacid:acceptor oxidoreductase gamma subunit (pyruvate/2-ketoisovalerate family)